MGPRPSLDPYPTAATVVAKPMRCSWCPVGGVGHRGLVHDQVHLGIGAKDQGVFKLHPRGAPGHLGGGQEREESSDQRGRDSLGRSRFSQGIRLFSHKYVGHLICEM